ncbi:MAG: trypsin-like peptidase domain-containing protein [Chloroflexi bacterium]|nr:trypsin-like peptidase domain-containing protein [Chloroflexota bacterium]
MRATAAILMALVLLGAAMGCFPRATPTPGSPTSETPTLPPPTFAAPASPSLNPANQTAGLPSLVDVVETVKPAVAAITVETVGLGFFFQPVPQQGAGSGFIFDPQGYILTNNHVVEGATNIQASLPDGRNFAANLVCQDPGNDLAVLKIEGTELPVLPFADSSSLRVGEWVVAVGNALGLEGGPTVTVGVVGALGRSIQEPGSAVLNNLVQTDAAINPGNSGGPLVNLRGEVVGVNTAIELEERVKPIGIGFAIASDTAREVARQLIARAQRPQPFLGVDAFTVTPAVAFRARLATDLGALVTRVELGSAAERAGLRPGDIVLGFEGQDIATADQLIAAIQARNIGDRVQIELLRGTRRLTVNATLGQAPCIALAG